MYYLMHRHVCCLRVSVLFSGVLAFSAIVVSEVVSALICVSGRIISAPSLFVAGSVTLVPFSCDAPDSVFDVGLLATIAGKISERFLYGVNCWPLPNVTGATSPTTDDPGGTVVASRSGIVPIVRLTFREIVLKTFLAATCTEINTVSITAFKL